MTGQVDRGRVDAVRLQCGGGAVNCFESPGGTRFDTLQDGSPSQPNQRSRLDGLSTSLWGLSGADQPRSTPFGSLFYANTATESSLQMNSVLTNIDPRLEMRSGRWRRRRRSTLCDQSEFCPDQAVGRFEPSPRGSSGNTPTPSVAIQTYYGLSSARRKMAGRTGDQRSKATTGALEMFQQCSPISMGDKFCCG